MTCKCPHCDNLINPAQLLAAIPSEKKAAAARENGKRGGRPRKPDPEEWLAGPT